MASASKASATWKAAREASTPPRTRRARISRFSPDRPCQLPPAGRPHRPGPHRRCATRFQRFLTVATTSYTNAGQDPWKTKLTLRGYDAARLTTLLGNFDALSQTGSTQDTTEGEAEVIAAERNAAYNTLREWMKEFAGTARGLFRNDPAQLAKLKLRQLSA
jgi:hypothetical protein